ncbi:glycosyltransferase family 4 protein [Cupriavidus sp. WS]|uniref:glycosyltransferase family 4 protein n=1 Tax=Cupriavidus sp. WS TaxID=1312922 RepID=UPI0007C6AF19|nr:glycosyltransferase family 4 protein [Cupriavidus sp. WS]
MFTRALPMHSIGGMQEVAWDVARMFAARGHDVTVITAKISGYPSFFEDSGVTVITVDGADWRRYGARWWDGSRAIFEREFANNCDGILSISAGAYGLLRNRSVLRGTPLILQAHGSSVAEFLSRWRTGRPLSMLKSVVNLVWIPKDMMAYRHFDAIVTVGDAVTKSFHRLPINLSVRRSQVCTIKNGIDTLLFRPNLEARIQCRRKLGWSDNMRVVVSVGRLHRQKGGELSLAAFARMVAEDYEGNTRYLIVGDGPERESLEQLAEELGVRNLVHFTGNVARRELAPYLQASDAMLFTTTHREGMPLNVLEAQAVGIPIVMSAHLKATFQPSERLLFAPPRDAAAVADALRTALQMSNDGGVSLPDSQSLAYCVDKYLALFGELRGVASVEAKNA